MSPKVINLILSEEEHAKHKEKKGGKSWKDYLLEGK